MQLDIFAINQWPGPNQQSDLQGLREVVQDAVQTLMVIDDRCNVQMDDRVWGRINGQM